MQVVFDHVHLVVTQPLAASNWLVDVLEGVRLGEATVLGSPQAYIRFGDSLVIVRGRRPGEPERVPAGVSMGCDHFGLRLTEDFDGYCGRLRGRGVRFLQEPVAINRATRVAFVEGPDAMAIELVERREWPDLRALGLDAGRDVTPPAMSNDRRG